MNGITTLILFPLVASLILFLVKGEKVRNVLVKLFALVVACMTLIVTFQNFGTGNAYSYQNEEVINIILMVLECLLAGYIIYLGIKNKKYLVSVFAAIQAPLILWFELTQEKGLEVENSIVFDKLTAVMILIIGILGSLICLYTVGYMKWYHNHHKEYKERKSFFFAVLFLFLSAMFGLVLSNNLTWIYFCWEITTFCSYLLIGYTKTEEAKNNSFRALTINVGGGLCFAIGIVLIGLKYKTLEMSVLTAIQPDSAILVPVFFLCVAALTKSAQLPFSSWLLGAMVAPTPSSALLHSATMVKAGVYLIIRLSPFLGTTSVGAIVTAVGSITFLLCSLIAISQSDGKKILAYSTLANLGLIVICASVGTTESLWAAILLVIFHAVSKSLLFLSVGSIEHQIGSRNVEDMDVLLKVSKRLSLYIMIGIAGMFLAPFGMLISKWAAMKAFIDSNHILTVVVIAFGSAATLFYWTKWLGKIVSNANLKKFKKHTFFIEEEAPIFAQAIIVVASCLAFPLISKYVLMPYLKEVFQTESFVLIGASDIKIMIFMLVMLIVLPISFIPFYKQSKRRIVPIYMAGENTGDNESFYGASGEVRQVELHNWYLKDYFKSTKLLFWGNLVSIVTLGAGIILLIGGLAK